jgi:hypothetical protein
LTIRLIADWGIDWGIADLRLTIIRGLQIGGGAAASKCARSAPTNHQSPNNHQSRNPKSPVNPSIRNQRICNAGLQDFLT